MGRFNWIWRTLRTLSVIMCAVCVPGRAQPSPDAWTLPENRQLGAARRLVLDVGYDGDAYDVMGII